MRHLLTKDLGWKLFSLFLALFIWLTVHQINGESPSPAGTESWKQITYENLPVLILSSASDVHDYRVYPDLVTVTVVGPKDVMAGLQASQVRASVDLTDIVPSKDLPRRVDVSVPANVTLVSVKPATVGVVLPPSNHK
jgi:YbbR domain-containing protein